MIEPIDIDVRREVAGARTASLLRATADGGGRAAPIRRLGTLLVSVGMRLAPTDSRVRPAVPVPSGRREAPGDPGASHVCSA